MSAGSDSSILGYGKMFPNSNINPSLANVYNMHDSANFGSRVIPGGGLQGAANNVDAVRGVVPCAMKGGKKTHVGNRRKTLGNRRKTLGNRRKNLGKTLRKKIKNIYRMYSMSGGKKASMHRKKTMKHRIKSRYLKKGGKSRRAHKCSSSCVHKRGKSMHKRRGHKRTVHKRSGHKRSGGSTVQYGLSAQNKLSPSLSALANPTPISILHQKQ